MAAAYTYSDHENELLRWKYPSSRRAKERKKERQRGRQREREGEMDRDRELQKEAMQRQRNIYKTELS
jgi:hypothetical protein